MVLEEIKERTMSLLLLLGWITVVLLHLRASWSKSVCNLNTGITRIRSLSKTDDAIFKNEHLERVRTSCLLQGKAPRFSRGRLRIGSSTGYPRYDWVDHW
jgi:hypothetical protein